MRKLKNAVDSHIYIIDYRLRRDDDAIDNFAERIQNEFANDMTIIEALKTINEISCGVDKIVKRNIEQTYEETCGVDVFVGDTQRLVNIENEWNEQQRRLVNSVISTFIEKLQIIISNAVQRGSSIDNVAEKIENLYGVTDKRAKFIARNEISNLNGILTKQRQSDCGIEAYEWSTSGDERVRATHEAMDGKLYYWNKSTYGKINGEIVHPAPLYHPGMDYNCRCVAIAVIDLNNWNVTNAIPLGEVQPKLKREFNK